MGQVIQWWVIPAVATLILFVWVASLLLKKPANVVSDPLKSPLDAFVSIGMNVADGFMTGIAVMAGFVVVLSTWLVAAVFFK